MLSPFRNTFQIQDTKCSIWLIEQDMKSFSSWQGEHGRGGYPWILNPVSISSWLVLSVSISSFPVCIIALPNLISPFLDFHLFFLPFVWSIALTWQYLLVSFCFFDVLLHLSLAWFLGQPEDERGNRVISTFCRKKTWPHLSLSPFVVVYVVQESKDRQIKPIRKQYFKRTQLIFRGCHHYTLTNTPTRSTLLSQPFTAKVSVACDYAIFRKVKCCHGCPSINQNFVSGRGTQRLWVHRLNQCYSYSQKVYG